MAATKKKTARGRKQDRARVAARKPTLRVWAEQTAFELKDSLKRRGYRWNDGSDGRPKSWFRDVEETALDDEIAFGAMVNKIRSGLGVTFRAGRGSASFPTSW